MDASACPLENFTFLQQTFFDRVLRQFSVKPSSILYWICEGKKELERKKRPYSI